MANTHVSGKATTDHGEIQKWIERRGGRPSVVSSTEGEGGGGILRIDFGDVDENLEEISWKDFFRIFEEHKLAFLRQEETADGQLSRFNKFVSRE